MTGAFNSVIGMEKENVIKHFLTRMPFKFEVATEDLGINCVVVSIDKKNFKPYKIERINYKI
jgi:calcineurin-like phosphoesterase